MNKMELLWERFVHRSDVFARQWFVAEKGSGYYRVTEGTCTQGCPKRDCPHITNVALTPQDVLQHLKGEETLAIYQMTEDNTVKWLCLDVDIVKGTVVPLDVVQEHTVNLVRTIAQHFDATNCIVEDSGNKGYHVWMFFDPPLQARYAFTLASWLDLQVPHSKNVHVDVFPRQTTIKSYGNMVKLPLGVHKKTGKRCFFVNGNFDPFKNQWKVIRDVVPLSQEEVLAFFKDHDIDPAPVIRVDRNVDTPGTGSLPCITHMMEEGLQQGSRDIGNLYIASWLKRRNIPFYVAEAALHAVNQKTVPPLDDDTLLRKVESAYDHDYSEFPCTNSALDQYCSSVCKFFPGKVKTRWTNIGQTGDPVGVISRD